MTKELVPQGLRETHGAIGEFLAMLPEMIDHTVSPCCDLCHLGGLVSRQVEVELVPVSDCVAVEIEKRSRALPKRPNELWVPH